MGRVTHPRQPAPALGDAERAPRELMTLPGMSRDVRDWKLVWIRIAGAWRSGILTVWRRPPGSAVWVAHVRWGEDDQREQRWGWFLYDPATIRPIPQPSAAAAVSAGATTVFEGTP
ncbi:hypothetical protein GCM10010430_79060 [Kitasatospora cystarginea]|uniref:Uncharacterized protein n=1 Tax=Kitasatospora cystarginea TaxID=58350 RepID=A0ABN3F2C1_9ACTN